MRTLRSYQETTISEIVQQFQKGSGAVLEFCVGAGKTLVALCIGATLLNQGFVDKVIFLTPQCGIRDQFAQNSGSEVRTQHSTLRIPEVTAVSETRFEDIFLESSMMVSTYQMWLSHFSRLDTLFRSLWSRTLIVVDEAHHIHIEAGGQTSDSVQQVLQCGAKVLQITATASRADQRTVILRDKDGVPFPRWERGLLQHMLEGFAPSLGVSLLTVPEAEDTKEIDVFSAPKEQFAEAAFQEILQDFLANGRPLSIVRLRCQKTDLNVKLRQRLQEVFEGHGVKTLIRTSSSTPTEEKQWSELNSAIQRGASYQEISTIANVLIVHQQLNEGVDLPAFSNLYLWGIPSHLSLMVQLAGRILRLRRDSKKRSTFEGYPEQWVDQSRVILCTGDNAFENQSEYLHKLGAWFYSLELGRLLEAAFPESLNEGFPKDHADVKGACTGVTSDTDTDTDTDAEVTVKKREPNHALAEKTTPYILKAEAFLQQCLDQFTVLTPQEYSRALKLIIFQFALEDGLELPPETASVIDMHTLVKNKNKGALLEESVSVDPDHLNPAVKAFSSFSYLDTKWYLSGDHYKHYHDLARAEGLHHNTTEIVKLAKIFRQKTGRWPGAGKGHLKDDPVPGETYCFDRFSSKPWKIEAALEEYKGNWRERVKTVRDYWGKQAPRMNFTKLQQDPLVAASALFAYFPQILWLPGNLFKEEVPLERLSEIGRAIGANRQYKEDVPIPEYDAVRAKGWR